MSVQKLTDAANAALGAAVAELHGIATGDPPASIADLVDAASSILGAQSGRLFVADYGLRSLRQLGTDGPIGASVLIEGTVLGRAFADGAVIATGTDPTVLRVPFTDGNERIGLLELEFDAWEGVPEILAPAIFVLVSVVSAKRRYSDAWVRCRRAEPLAAAAEVQWDLLPPLAASAPNVAVAGILEPAYSIGGDSFDYALNERGLDFAIVDAVGHGMSAVLMAAAAVNGFRNVRREGGALPTAHEQVDRLIADYFGDFQYVTGQFGSLDTCSGILRWVNCGHPLPLLVRNGTFAGTLTCTPSKPLGLGGSVVEIAEEPLQGGDRVLFYTDGITESRSNEGEMFGESRLADYLVRATLDRVPVAETVRRLSANVLAFVGGDLKDDATMFLIEYRAGTADGPDDN